MQCPVFGFLYAALGERERIEIDDCARFRDVGDRGGGGGRQGRTCLVGEIRGGG